MEKNIGRIKVKNESKSVILTKEFLETSTSTKKVFVSSFAEN